MNCVLFAKLDQVFSLKNKTLKKYWKNGKKVRPGILSEKWVLCGHTFFRTRIVYSKFDKVTSMEYFNSSLKWVLKSYAASPGQ